MSRSTWTVVLGAALAAFCAYQYQSQTPVVAPCPCQPDAKPKPKTPNKPAPKKPRGPCGPGPCPMEGLNGVGLTPWLLCEQAPPTAPAERKRPRRPRRVVEGDKPQKGGVTSPDGAVNICFDLDSIDWPKNIASKGLGCCGFRSFDYCARIQNVPEVVNLPENMRDKGIAGGDYPEKHAQVVAKMCPGVEWWQDTSKSIELVQASIKSKRPCCVDYNGHDPHYSGGIAHCVTCVACDVEADWVAILDNNYPSLDEIIWMSVAEFSKRWGGWAYGLLAETPGKLCEKQLTRRADTESDRAGPALFGGREGPFGPGESSINGSKCDQATILERIGPEMIPKLPALPVNVDHRLDLENLQLPLLAAGAVGFALWVINDKKCRK